MLALRCMKEQLMSLMDIGAVFRYSSGHWVVALVSKRARDTLYCRVGGATWANTSIQFGFPGFEWTIFCAS